MARDQSLYSFARLEQAHLVAELVDGDTAASLAQSVYRNVGRQVPASLRCWMAAGVAEMHALAGDGQRTRELMTEAERLTTYLSEPSAPYLVFNLTHLHRWIGHTLVILGDTAAEAHLREADQAMDSTFTRASASLHLDLASVLLARREYDEGTEQLTMGELLARRVGSRRHLARAGVLRASAPGK